MIMITGISRRLPELQWKFVGGLERSAGVLLIARKKEVGSDLVLTNPNSENNSNKRAYRKIYGGRDGCGPSVLQPEGRRNCRRDLGSECSERRSPDVLGTSEIGSWVEGRRTAA